MTSLGRFGLLAEITCCLMTPPLCPLGDSILSLFSILEVIKVAEDEDAASVCFEIVTRALLHLFTTIVRESFKMNSFVRVFALCLVVGLGSGQFQRPLNQFRGQTQNQGTRSFTSQNQIEPSQGKSSGRGSCPDKYGRYPVPSQCDAYIECKDGVAEEKMCPEGLLFNPDAHFNYPCAYPIDVSCEGRTGLQQAQPTDECPHQFGYFKIGDRANCGQFMNCADGRAYVFDCPEGLAYNPETYRCDWPDMVADCDSEAFLGFSCPNDKGPVPPGDVRFFRSPSDCQKYFICVNGKPRLMNCGDGNAFDETTYTCEAAVNVTGCAPGQIRAAPQRIQGFQQPKPQQQQQQRQFGFQSNQQQFRQNFQQQNFQQQNRQQQNYQRQPFTG